MKDKIRVVELFAGVGGFRLGLERASKRYEVVWSNQWEPSTKIQHASFIYTRRFGIKNHSNDDISSIPTAEIPEHDLLVGGFPCQDYSVARTLNNAKGLVGKKGVLWWEIHRILKDKKPSYVFLENVDRLIKSPANQRGRDFAIMLASLSDLGYVVEWRIINAADYGMPQRRRRIFLLAYRFDTAIAKAILQNKHPEKVLEKVGVFAKPFPIAEMPIASVRNFVLDGELDVISKKFNKTGTSLSVISSSGISDDISVKGNTPFENTGFMFDRKVFTTKTVPAYTGPRQNLGDVILKNGSVPLEYYIKTDELERWAYLKGSKKETRTNKEIGFEYAYNEGPMTFPDPLDSPSRTIITGEGGSGASRFKHVILTAEGKLRRLMPIELERLNMFPDDHTQGVSDQRRAFFMGNALVVGIVENVGREFAKRLAKERRAPIRRESRK